MSKVKVTCSFAYGPPVYTDGEKVEFTFGEPTDALVFANSICEKFSLKSRFKFEVYKAVPKCTAFRDDGLYITMEWVE